MLTLGKRCCNPLNIRYNEKNHWRGQIGSYKGFCCFDCFESGFRAALILLRNYVRFGVNTPRKIISRWAPSNENDTESYIKNCRYPWHEDYTLSSIEDICILASGMAYHESLVDVTPSALLDIAHSYNIRYERKK